MPLPVVLKPIPVRFAFFPSPGESLKGRGTITHSLQPMVFRNCCHSSNATPGSFYYHGRRTVTRIPTQKSACPCHYLRQRQAHHRDETGPFSGRAATGRCDHHSLNLNILCWRRCHAYQVLIMCLLLLGPARLGWHHSAAPAQDTEQSKYSMQPFLPSPMLRPISSDRTMVKVTL